MASVFILGPSKHRDTRTRPSPRQIRERLVALFSTHHHAYILEPLADEAHDRDLADKFFRTLRDKRTTDVLIYWPLYAKMQTTLDEIILLRARLDRPEAPSVWLLHETGVLRRTTRGYEIPAGVVERSRYLDAINTLGAIAFEWADRNSLFALPHRLSDNLADEGPTAAPEEA